MTSTAASSGLPDWILDCERISKWYGPISALTDVTLRVGREVVGLVGRSGAGKSTLMKLAVGLLRPSQGSIRVAGHPAGSRGARACSGLCPDTERLYDALSGVDFVAWMLRYHGLGHRECRERSAATLTELGLGEHMHRPIREYSKGMRQRVRLAQALAHRPRFALLDEPMTGLDPLARRELGERIRRLPEQGVGVLVSSHVLQELQGLVDRVVMLHQGRVLAEGTVAEIREQMPAAPHRVRIGAADPRRLAAELVHWPSVQGVRFGDSSVLELSVTGEPDFYIALTELGTRWPGGLREITPLDDDLASVFGYLLG
ncbi:MAG: ABC transporter ATP-binding protein [Planctomycetes bacterium]|nr:ABC transporter ATP-binding protein [Planctomycetota bacterium]